ncbi:MAG: glycosyltransferase family 1 protein [Chlamydiales bacterium]
MVHVCVDARMWGHHGIGTFLKNCLQFLAQNPSIDLTLLHYPKDFDTLSGLCSRSILMSAPIYSVKEQYELALKIPRADLFWSPHFNIPLFPILAKKRLVAVHDVYFLFNYSNLSFKKKCYVKTFYNAALMYSDVVMTGCNAAKKDIEKFCSIKPKRVEIVPHALKSFGKEDKDQSVQKLPDSYLLYVGRVAPHKNLFRLVEAYERLKCTHPLVVVGVFKPPFSDYQKTLLDYVNRSSYLSRSVLFVGEVGDTDLSKIYSQAELLVFPSYYEGYGLPPLEAMLFDCPVVASNIAPVQEVCGEAVEYIDPYSVDSICKGIVRLMEDRKRRQYLIEKGREQIQYYTPENMTKRLLEVIDVCCSRP